MEGTAFDTQDLSSSPDIRPLRSERERSGVPAKLGWFAAGALALAVVLIGAALLEHSSSTSRAVPALTPSDVLPGSQAYLFTTLSATKPGDAPGVLSNDPTGSCGIIWHLPSGDMPLHLVVVQPMKVSASSAVTVTRLSLGLDDGPSAIGPAGHGGAQTFPASWSFALKYRARPGAIFAAYARVDLRSSWWRPGSYDVLRTLSVTYTLDGQSHTIPVPLGRPACIGKPDTRPSTS